MHGAKQKLKKNYTLREGFYFMEVCDQVQAVNLVLREKDIPLHVFIEPRRISTQSYDGSMTVYPLTLEVEPSSCSSMEYKSQTGLSMRLQLRSVEELPPSHIPMGSLVQRLGDAFERLNGQPCLCGCRACGINMLKMDVRFNRVLNLPSNNWEDLSSSWTCCSHSHKDPTIKTIKKEFIRPEDFPFVPRIGECFVDDFCIIFYPKAVMRNNVLLYPPPKCDTSNKKTKRYEKSIMKCGRCLAIVGEALIIDDNTVRTYNFFKSAVEFRSFYEKFPLPIFNSTFFLERVLASQLFNEIKMNMTYRFIIQDDKKKPYLLIHVLNAQTRVRLNQTWCEEPLEGLNRGNSAFGCCSIPQRYLGSEEWELSAPKMTKVEKENALQDSEKLLERVMMSLDTTEESLANLHAKLAQQPKAETGVIKKLVPPDVWELYMFSSNNLTVGRTCEDGAVDDACGLERVVKVMYTSVSGCPDKKIVENWEQDANVHTITFPYSICIEATLVLTTSTLSLPISQRLAQENFLFGLLRLE